MLGYNCKDRNDLHLLSIASLVAMLCYVVPWYVFAANGGEGSLLNVEVAQCNPTCMCVSRVTLQGTDNSPLY